MDLNKIYDELLSYGANDFGNAVKVRSGLFSESDLINVFSGGNELFFQLDKKGVLDIMNVIVAKISQLPSKDSYNHMIDILNLIQKEINNYYGKSKGNSRLSFYMNNGSKTDNEDVRICSMSQIKELGLAKCAEKASLANNILLMLNSMGLFEYKVNYLNAITTLNNKSPEGHAFLEFSRINSKGETIHIIYDVTNPEIIISNDEEYSYPAIYSLTEDEYKLFLNGKKFDNSKFVMNNYYQLKEKREYSGFKTTNNYEDDLNTFEKLENEMTIYKSNMKTFLPIEEQIKKLRRSGKSTKEIKSILGSNSYIFDYVPNVLYHGSPESLDIISSKESTQKGSYVYATDNPIHALFFSIFRNSSIARAHIDEYIDENGNYKVKYIVDERVQGALDEIITDKNVTIHVCDGEQFFKPQGEAYIGREWISKDGQDIIPTDKIQVNVKNFFENLEKQGLVEYDRYDKSKDWKTVIDMLGQNYPFGLGTEIGKNIQKIDAMYDEFIENNFPKQLEFSKKFREFIKGVMAIDYKLENPSMTLEEENNYKLRYIKNTAYSFLLAKKDENGKIAWNVDMNKINEFMNKEANKQGNVRKLMPQNSNSNTSQGYINYIILTLTVILVSIIISLFILNF